MKEFSFTLEDELTIGLKPRLELKTNSGFFSEFKNVEPSPYGARPFSYTTVPWTAQQLYSQGIEVDFPFPQLVRLKNFTLLLGATYVFHVNEEDWTLVQLDTYDFNTPANTKTIPTGHYWQYADFWDTFVLTNGSCSIWYDKSTDKLLVETSTRFSCVTDYKGRAIFAGFNPNYDRSSAWTSYWTSQNSTIIGTNPDNLDWNWIKWTSIGRGLDVLIKADMTQLDILKNDFGEMPLDDRSAIIAVKKFGRGLVAYSYAEATLMSHKSAPLNTISPEDNGDLGPGIVNPGAVAGDKKNHVWVSSDLELWWLGSGGAVNLGYNEYLAGMTGEIIVSHNTLTGSFYISSQDKTYTLTWNKPENKPQGFAESSQMITSCVSDGANAYSLGSDIDNISLVWNMVSDEFDLYRTGDKTIGWIVCHGTEIFDRTMQARVHYQLTYKKDWEQSSWRTVNKYGAAYFPITAARFKVEVKGNNFTQIEKISRIDVTDQLPDNRFTRGPNVNKINSSANS